MTDPDPLMALYRWFEQDLEERRRLIGTSPNSDQGQLVVALALSRLDEAGAAELISCVDGVLNAPTKQQDAIEDWVGKPLLQSLRRTREQVDVDALERTRATMRAETDGQEQAGRADYATLSRQAGALRELVGPVRSIVGDIYGHLQEKSAQNHISALEEAARRVPGTNLRITETVAGPDGTQHVVRDEMALGPDPNLANLEVSYALSTGRKQLLGLDDQRSAEIAGDQVQHLRARRMLERLGLTESASVEQVHDRAIRHLLGRGEMDAAIGDLVGGIPQGMVGLLPGHLPALRASALLIIIEAIQDAASRGRRGDRVAGAGGEHVLLVGMALAHGSVYHLPAAMIPPTDSRGEGSVELSSGDIVVFHDRPVLLGPGAEAIAWVFTTDDAGVVLDFAQVLLEAGDQGSTGIELSNVNLARGPAAAMAARVLAGIAHPGWQVAKRRKLPGRVGDKAWRDALGKAAATELRTGSLCAVHTRTPAV